MNVPPSAPPSLLEDLGTVGAVSCRRDPLCWIAAGALLVSTCWWAPTSVAVGWCLVVALALLPPPFVPRVLLRGWGAAALIVVAGVTIGVTARSDQFTLVSLEVLLCAGQAAAIPWAAAVGRARRYGAEKEDAEAASARLAIWTQEHPWRTACAVLPLVGPCGSLWLQAWIATDQASEGDIPPLLMVPHWMTPGALLLVAAPLGRRVLRALELAIVGLAVAGGVWAAAVWIGDLSAGAFHDETVQFLLGLGGASVVLLVAAAYTVHIPFGWPRHARAAWIAAWLAAEVGLAALVAHCTDRRPPPLPLDDWLLVLARHGFLLALLGVAAASTLRGRTMVVLLVTYGAVVTLVAACIALKTASGLRYAPVAALGCLNQALFALAARRIRSMTVVPRDHVLRADWAVDLRTGPSPVAAPRG